MPTSQDVDEAKIRQMGLANCPFTPTTFDVKDGRKAALHNSAFGTVFGVADDKPLPVCDYAGFAPFGFGYRRCPGEQFTVEVIKDLLRTVWQGGIEFVTLDLEHPERLPVGPGTVIEDTIAFKKTG